MSTREMAYEIVNGMDEEQLEKFIEFFNVMFKDTPNDETLSAIEEAERMLDDPNTRKFATVDELFEELNS